MATATITSVGRVEMELNCFLNGCKGRGEHMKLLVEDLRKHLDFHNADFLAQAKPIIMALIDDLIEENRKQQ